MLGKFSLIMFLFFSITVFAQSGVKIFSSDRSSIVIEYSPVYSDTSVEIIDNHQYINIGVKNSFISEPEKWGEPSIPEIYINLGVPSEFGNTIEILGTSYKEIRGLVTPKPKTKKEGLSYSSYYEISPAYNSYKSKSELVSFADFGYIRDLPVQSLTISPVQFDVASQNIRLYKTIKFRINFNSKQKITSVPSDGFAAGTILNFNVAKYWVRQSKSQSLKKTVINSVLSTGKWVKFEAPEEGIYKITYSMLSSFGIDAATVDPRSIKIFNNSGKPIPEDPTISRPSDLVENAIIVSGESDGKFDSGDYILFYGRGNNFWDYDTTSHSIKRVFNIYSDHNYYWITSGGTNGKRVENEPSLSQQNVFSQTSSKAFTSWDEDKINLINSGKEFLGDDFSYLMTSRTYTNKLDGRIDGSPIQYNFVFVTAASNPTNITVQENNTTIWNKNMSAGTALYVGGASYSATVYYNGSLTDSRSLLKFSFTPSTNSDVGYLDYFEILYQKQLTAANDFCLFFSKDTTATIEYHLTNFSNSNIKVFNVSDYSGMKQITGSVISGGECHFQVSEQQGYVSKYIAIANDNYKTPINPQEAENSNIHGIADGAKFIIITHKNFMDAANRLKNYRENEAKNKISTIVIDIDQIFNEFACGLPDVSGIRDFIKYAYDNWQIKPEYVLFFGDGDYDYKDIQGFHTNFLPPYETQESLNEINSYTTDDYFDNLDADQKIDIASGRLTVKTAEEANNIVDKIIYYETSSEKGLWRNLITLVADDGYQGASYGGNYFTSSSEQLANHIIPASYDNNKLYMAAYPVVITGNGKRIPEGNKAIIDAINNGSLIVNYVGHGSPDLWADEDVFVRNVTIPQLHNDKYFFLVAATCDFGFWDIPNFSSAAQDLVLDANAGAVGALCSSRLVYQDSNEALMDSFFQELLSSSVDSLTTISTGKAVLYSKQSLINDNDRKYFLFGDPTMYLLAPEFGAVIDSINGQQLTGNVQIKALNHTQLSGTILKPDSTTWNDFNGEGILTVFDSKRTEVLPNLRGYQITRQGGLIFRGRVSITNGKFDADFVVPKDISYANQNGKIVFYYFNTDVDGLGYTGNIIVGGTDTTVVNDGKGPSIDIYFDNSSAANAYLVNPNSTLNIKLSDETGLNTTGTGIGHQLEGVLNNDENNPIDFSNYFTGDLNAGGRSGEVNYKFNNLEQGDYSLLVKAWDVFNNFNSETVYFTVVSGEDLEIRDVYNYPNPFAGNTTFTFQRNQITPAEVRIKIYTISGRLIREIEQSNIIDKFVRINWDGRDQDGNIIANGTYLYKVIVKNLDGNYMKSVLGKLAVIR
jgi:Peptidase family C25/Propeptide_C25/FlgD Ig-like domain